jgi:hypothetical protein
MIHARLKSVLFLCMVGVLLTMAMTACSKSLSEAVTVLDEEMPVTRQSEATDETTALADTAEPQQRM